MAWHSCCKSIRSYTKHTKSNAGLNRMGTSSSVLVLGTDERSDLVETLFDLGFMPLMRKEMQRALDRIRHEQFAAVFLDRKKGEVDVLEFILNVRDIDPQVPVIVIGKVAEESQRKFIFTQEHVFLFNDTPAELKREIPRVLT